MQSVPRALAAAAEKAGVGFRYGSAVSRVDVRGGRAHGVVLDGGEYVRADAVVLTPDAPVAIRELLPPQAAGRVWTRRLPRQKYSPSCFLLLAGSSCAYPGAGHHTISFGHAWRRTFSELIDRRELMSDPSLLVTCATASDPELAPAGRHTYYVLAPTPNLDARLDWSVIGPRYRDELIETLEQRGWAGFGSGIETSRITTPADWRAQGLERGAPFAAAHTFMQTGPLRLPNLLPNVENVVLAGSGTVPGVGVPMVLVSGRLAAQRIAGTDLDRRPRTAQTYPLAAQQPARRRVVVAQPVAEGGKP
jgi:phytoene desaturase